MLKTVPWIPGTVVPQHHPAQPIVEALPPQVSCLDRLPAWNAQTSQKSHKPLKAQKLHMWLRIGLRGGLRPWIGIRFGVQLMRKRKHMNDMTFLLYLYLHTLVWFFPYCTCKSTARTYVIGNQCLQGLRKRP